MPRQHISRLIKLLISRPLSISLQRLEPSPVLRLQLLPSLEDLTWNVLNHPSIGSVKVDGLISVREGA